MDDHHSTAVITKPPKHLDYSLTGEESKRAIERGLAEADWYQTPVPRARLSHLLETENSARKISCWYGARSRQEIFYRDYFEQLAVEHPNFEFHLALSSPLPEDEWDGHPGFIHDVVLDNYLAGHSDVRMVEFYLCGPPMMIKACTKMLAGLGVDPSQIAYDEF